MSKKPEKKPKLSEPPAAPPSKAVGSSLLPPYLLIFFLGLGLYANTIYNGYAVDDTLVITSNQFTQLGTAGIAKIFTNDAFVGHYGERGKQLVQGGRYRPLSIASFALEIELFGKDQPGISHAVNALLYGLTAVLLFYLLLLLFPLKQGSSVWTSLPFWATVLYAVHPLHTEAVANIKGRDEMFAFLFSIIALLCSILYVRKSKPLFLLTACLAFMAGIFSKENTVTFLAVIPLCLWTFEKFDFKKFATVVGPMVLITVLFLILREKYTDASQNNGTREILNNPFIYSTFSQHYGTIIYTFLVYLKLLFVPYPLTHDYYPYHIPVYELSHPLVLLSLAVHISLFTYALILLRRKDALGFAILFFYSTFSVVSQLIFQVGTNMSERFLYMPSFGFILAILLWFRSFANKDASDFSKAKLGLLILIALCFAYISFDRNKDWENNFTLFAADTPISRNSMKANMEYGGELTAMAIKQTDTVKGKKMLALAIDHLEKAIELYPKKDNDGRAIGYANAYNLLGNAVYHYRRDYKRAEEAYLNAAKYRPGHFDAFSNLVVVYNEQQKYDLSVPYLRVLLASNPQNGKFSYQMAECYRSLQKADSALPFYQKCMELDPGMAVECQYKMGICLARMLNRYDEGIVYLQKAYQAEPENSVYIEDLAVAYGMKGDPANSAPLLEKLVQLNPNYENAYVNLIVSYNLLGNKEKALEYTMKLNALRATKQQ